MQVSASGSALSVALTVTGFTRRFTIERITAVVQDLLLVARDRYFLVVDVTVMQVLIKDRIIESWIS